MGLRSKGACTDRLPVGMILQKCRLDFRNQGELEFDLQVVGHGLAGERTVHHIGCTFVALAPGQQTFLQRLAYHIELASREARMRANRALIACSRSAAYQVWTFVRQRP
ncbi:hypothetical protein [Cupriavidus sp. CuC1]|uniref:hypothetical protein n=1 Tax=Cupriavidus sp. CuC1 TaxID=3373131 RepID=UPI0037D0E579